MSTPDGGALPPTKPSALSETAALTTTELANALDACPTHELSMYVAIAIDRLRALAAATEEKDKAPPTLEKEKIAPVQGYTTGIPWSMHIRAYDVYRQRYGAQEALITGWCRGGFHTSELDMFIPGWREELSELTALKSKLTELERENRELRERATKLAQEAEDFHAHTVDQGWVDADDDSEGVAKLKAAIDAARNNGGAT